MFGRSRLRSALHFLAKLHKDDRSAAGPGPCSPSTACMMESFSAGIVDQANDIPISITMENVITVDSVSVRVVHWSFTGDNGPAPHGLNKLSTTTSKLGNTSPSMSCTSYILDQHVELEAETRSGHEMS